MLSQNSIGTDPCRFIAKADVKVVIRESLPFFIEVRFGRCAPFNSLGVGGSDIPVNAMVVAYHRPLNLENLFSYRKLNKHDGPSVSISYTEGPLFPKAGRAGYAG